MTSVEERVLSIDVEAVATGVGHNDREAAWVAVVELGGRVLYNELILVENMHSPLTHITGVTREMLLERGKPRSEVLREVHALLDSSVVLVGQNPQGDCDWLELQPKEHYARLVDLSIEFRTWNSRYSNWNYFGLAQAAYGLLNRRIQGEGESHDPAQDAAVSLELWDKWVRSGRAQQAGTKLTRMRYNRSFPAPPSHVGVSTDGVCSFAFNPRKCHCGQPTKRQQK